MSSDLVGKNLGKYHIVERLGRGGMGIVYKAYDPGLSRFVAIKVVYSIQMPDEDEYAEAVERFQREAYATARLRHNNIVQVLDYGLEGDIHYMVMEFIDGPTLEAELKERKSQGDQPFDLAEIERIFSVLASAIDFAHGRGVVHHDLRPANIMFTASGQVRLTDFGLARLIDAPAYTVTGNIMGTLDYMAPEQFQGERQDKRSDIYSLGIVLYEMVTGQVPFASNDPVVIMNRHINEPPPPPSMINSNVSKAVEQVILKALSKNSAERYDSALDLVAALKQAADRDEDAVPAVPPFSLIKRISRSIKERQFLGAGIAVAVLSIVVALGWAAYTFFAGGAIESDLTVPSPVAPVVVVAPTATGRPAFAGRVPTGTPAPTVVPTTTLIPTLTATPASSSTPTAASTRSATVIPTTKPTPTPTPTPNPPTSTPTITPVEPSSVPSGTLKLLSPLQSREEPSYGRWPTVFEWQWNGAIRPGFGFEVRVWREGELPAAVHNAVLDNQKDGDIERIGENRYRLTVSDIENVAGVRGRSGTYLWTVALVQISPNYADLGQQAEPVDLRIEISSGGGKDDDGGDGGVGVD